MPSRLVFSSQNNFAQGANRMGICTVASLQWAKMCLKRGRGLGSYAELGLDNHVLNGLMAVHRNNDHDAQLQTSGMGLSVVGADIVVNQFIDIQRHTNLTNPHICIFWDNNHTMGYRVSTKFSREVEFFDVERGLYLANNDTDIRQTYHSCGYPPPIGMRIIRLG